VAGPNFVPSGGFAAVSPRRAVGAGRLLLVLAALLAFSWQSLIAAMHAHLRAPAEAVSLVAGDAAGAAARPGQPSDIPAQCPVCRELAHGATYVPPAPPALAAPLPLWRAEPVAAPAPRPPLAWRGHGWRSRAPPLPSVL